MDVATKREPWIRAQVNDALSTYAEVLKAIRWARSQGMVDSPEQIVAFHQASAAVAERILKVQGLRLGAAS